MLRPNSLPLIVLLAGLQAFGPISTDLYLSSLPAIAEAFGAEVNQGQLTLSAFLAGLAVSMLFAGALGDRFGRRPILLIGTAGYVVVAIACVFAPTIEALLVLRFVQGIFSCTAPVLARAVVRDLHGREEAARMLGYVGGIMGIIPVVVPIVGGYMLEAFGWTSNFWFMAAYSALACIAVAVLLQETSPRHASDALNLGLILKSFATVLRHRTTLAYGAPFTFAYCGMFAFFTGFPVILIRELRLPPEWFGFYFAPVISGFMLGALFAGRFGPRVGVERLFVVATILAILSGVALAAFPLFGIVNGPSLVIPGFGFMLSIGLLNPIATAAVLAPFPAIAGKTSALLGTVQMTAGAIGGYVVGGLGDGSARWMTLVVGCCGIGVFISHAFLRDRDTALRAA